MRKSFVDELMEELSKLNSTDVEKQNLLFALSAIKDRYFILKEVPEEERKDGVSYISDMKHGYIEGYWNSDSKECSGYYWQDIYWTPYTTYIEVELV